MITESSRERENSLTYYLVMKWNSSEIEKLVRGEEEPPFIESIGKFFATPGFFKPLADFIMSISITNIVGVSV